MTIEQIFQIAPDIDSVHRAEELAFPFRWNYLAGNERALWGEYKAGPTVFFVAVDLNGNGFKCSCPSRKYPCKHGLALLMLLLKSNGEFAVPPLPDWVEKWLVTRDKKKEKKQITDEKAVENGESSTSIIPQNIEKLNVSEDRIASMQQGIGELKIWLEDLFRQGILSFEEQSVEKIKNIAARMVDAKLGGLAKRLRLIETIKKDTVNWVEPVVDELSSLYLFCSAFEKIQTFSNPLQADLLNIAGVNIKKEEVMQQDSVEDYWVVLCHFETEEENLLVKKNWLYGGKTKRFALILEYAFGGTPFEYRLPFGNIFQGQLVFYPSVLPQRALIKQQKSLANNLKKLDGFANFEAMLEEYATHLSQLPWRSVFPCVLENCSIIEEKKHYFLIDENHQKLPLIIEKEQFLNLLALSGGQTLTLFGEWNAYFFLPMSVFVEQKLILIS